MGADRRAVAHDGTTVLMQAAIGGGDAVVQLLIDAGADIQARRADGGTALLLAAEYGSASVVRRLARAGARADAVAGDGRTPLVRAIARGDHDTVAAVLEAGIDPNGRERGETALMHAVKRADAASLELLLAARAEVNAVSDPEGHTALMLAANRGLTTLVGRLIAAGADVNIEARDGWTAAAAAEMIGETELAETLRRAGRRTAP
jgi:uncharacterized protein